MIAKSTRKQLMRLRLAGLLIVAVIFLAPLSAGAEGKLFASGQLQQGNSQPSQQAADEEDLSETVEAGSVSSLTREFLATAYCLQGITFSGVRVNRGVIAADPSVLPMGSIVRLYAGEHSGIYTVLDTGAKIKGRRIDLWLPTYREAIEFGARKVRVEIIRYGWDPTGPEIGNLSHSRFSLSTGSGRITSP